MNTTRESIDFKKYIVKRSTPDNFGLQLRDFCQLFRFYSSVILVIVGKDISLSRNKINRLTFFFIRYDWFSTFNKSIFIDENSTKFI